MPSVNFAFVRRDVYIRPGPVFPDGYMIPAGLVPVLVADHLIAPDDTWHDREDGEPGDYYAIYEDEVDIERVGYDIEEHLRRWIAPGAYR